MGVDHRRAHVGVAQQLLHRADVIAAFQKVRGEGVPKGVGRCRLDDTGIANRLPDGPLDDLVAEVMAAIRAEVRKIER